LPEDYIKKIKSTRNMKYIADSAAKGALSKWLETDGIRMRVLSYPPNFKADHICYKGHAIYIVAGTIKIKIENEIWTWKRDDALIIPENLAHEVINDNEKEAKVIVMDNK